MTYEETNKMFLHIIVCLCALFVGVMIGIVIDVQKYNTTSPVEEMDTVKKLTNSADSIKLIIINLDSAKRDDIQKVQTLDNDSSLKLFYELLRR